MITTLYFKNIHSKSFTEEREVINGRWKVYVVEIPVKWDWFGFKKVEVKKKTVVMDNGFPCPNDTPAEDFLREYPEFCIRGEKLYRRPVCEVITDQDVYTIWFEDEESGRDFYSHVGPLGTFEFDTDRNHFGIKKIKVEKRA